MHSHMNVKFINILRNKHTKKNCAPAWLYLQDNKGMHSQENFKKKSSGIFFMQSQFEIWVQRMTSNGVDMLHT